MYNVFIKRKDSYNPDLVGEFASINDALDLANKYKSEDETISYTIEETTWLKTITVDFKNCL